MVAVTIFGKPPIEHWARLDGRLLCSRNARMELDECGEFTHECARCHQPILRTTHGVWLTSLMAGSAVCARGMNGTGPYLRGHEPL